MIRLFDVPNGRRVRITSKQIRYADKGVMKTLLQEVTWTGTTTGHYWMYEGVQRRLVTDHSIECGEMTDGVWQRDVECYIIG